MSPAKPHRNAIQLNLPELCDEYVSGFSEFQQGSIRTVSISLKPMSGERHRELKRELHDFLSHHWQGSGDWPYFDYMLCEPELTEREFWACVVAELRSEHFVLPMYGDDELRASAVSDLLARTQIPLQSQ